MTFTIDQHRRRCRRFRVYELPPVEQYSRPRRIVLRKSRCFFNFDSSILACDIGLDTLVSQRIAKLVGVPTDCQASRVALRGGTCGRQPVS